MRAPFRRPAPRALPAHCSRVWGGPGPPLFLCWTDGCRCCPLSQHAHPGFTQQAATPPSVQAAAARPPAALEGGRPACRGAPRGPLVPARRARAAVPSVSGLSSSGLWSRTRPAGVELGGSRPAAPPRARGARLGLRPLWRPPRAAPGAAPSQRRVVALERAAVTALSILCVLDPACAVGRAVLQQPRARIVPGLRYLACGSCYFHGRRCGRKTAMCAGPHHPAYLVEVDRSYLLARQHAVPAGEPVTREHWESSHGPSAAMLLLQWGKTHAASNRRSLRAVLAAAWGRAAGAPPSPALRCRAPQHGGGLAASWG